MNGIIGISGVIALLLATAGVIALLRPGAVSWRWLLTASGLVLLNDALLTNVYGRLPELFPASDWNWQGKALALAATLVVAALPVFGWRRSGLTLAQARGGILPAAVVSLAYLGFFLALALMFPNEPASAETILFQLTMPGLEEEPFYRGVLLLALCRAFPGERSLLGVDWSWGALVSCLLFGLAHAFGFSNGAFQFDPLTMALTAGPSLLAVWLVLKTRSLLIPVVLHNFGNAVMLLI